MWLCALSRQVSEKESSLDSIDFYVFTIRWMEILSVLSLHGPIEIQQQSLRAAIFTRIGLSMVRMKRSAYRARGREYADKRYEYDALHKFLKLF